MNLPKYAIITDRPVSPDYLVHIDGIEYYWIGWNEDKNCIAFISKKKTFPNNESILDEIPSRISRATIKYFFEHMK